MFPDKVDVSTHSILGTVPEYYQHQALEDSEKENEDITLKLPPIFTNKSNKENVDPNTSSIQKALNSPTIPSLFSPMTKNSKYRYKSNLKDLKRGQSIEKQKETRKLQQLLKGDRIYATREERVLKRWEDQQRQWKSLKKNIAQKIGKKQDELVITRAEEWREMVEEIDLMTKSIPASAISSSHWQHSLRKKTGDEETTHLVPVGNIFSGLYCKVTHNRAKPMKESVRKPRKYVKNSNPNHYNLPGKGAASKHWRERTVTYQFRKRLHKKMVQLKPNNLDELDGLEIVGQNMFNIDKLELPSYSYERLSKSKDMCTDHKYDKTNSDTFDEESYQMIEYENVPIIGPSVEFNPGNVILFNTALYEEQTRVLKIENNGTTAMLFRFENVEQKFKDNALFLYPTEQFSILPGNTKSIAFYFKPSKPGSYHLVIGIESFPNISQKHIELQAICLTQDEDKIHRSRFIKQMITDQIEKDVTNLLNNMIENISEPMTETDNLPKLFCERNRDHKLYWYPEILDKLQILSKTIISKFRRRKRNSYKWDLSVQTLLRWLNELESIQSKSVIQSWSDQLTEYIEFAQNIPPINPLYYDLCSTLISDLALQMPRFSWRANQSAQITHKTEESESDTSAEEWNVFESENYKNTLYQYCNGYMCHIIDQFENCITNNNQINESVTIPIKSKLNPKPQKIITFGSWVCDDAKSELVENANETDTKPIIQSAEIEPLYNYCIESIHSNSKITVMSSLYKTWICPNKQSFKMKKPTQNLPQTTEASESDTTDDESEQKSQLNDFKLLPIFKGFNIIQIFCCEDMINVLTDTGDVYCSLFNDLSLHKTEILCNKQIIKICGNAQTNKCIALSESGEIFEWGAISETTENSEEKTDKSDDAKSDNTEQKISNVFHISDAKQVLEIDEKIKDIAITNNAYTAITESNKLIIWGNFNEIYSEKIEKEDSKGKKSKKGKGKPQKTEEIKEENNETPKPYKVIEFKKMNENSEEETIDLKYTTIVSCMDSFIVLTENGTLYSFGNNENGALGLGQEIKQSLQPKLIVFESESTDIIIESVSSCMNGCVTIDSNGNVYYWGKSMERLLEITENDKEQKCDKETVFYVPTKIEIESQVNRIRKAIVSNVGGFLWC